MKKALMLAAAVSAAVFATASANAEGGCGPGGHRGAFGHCRPNGYGPGPLVVDRYYGGRGYWDGQRYWHHRHPYHHGWRYY